MGLCAGLTVLLIIIIQGILATSLGYTSRILNTGVVYYILIVDRTNYTIHIMYNLLHVMLDDNLLLYGPQIVMYYLYVYDAVESGIKQLNWIELKEWRH